jgi:hypothetical protein
MNKLVTLATELKNQSPLVKNDENICKGIMSEIVNIFLKDDNITAHEMAESKLLEELHNFLCMPPSAIPLS